jgi:beta-mannosidase
LGAVTLYGYVELLAQKIFGEFTSGEDRIRKMQMLQCEWIRLTLELYRRNKWFSSGILYWMYNDCWPAANGWSIVDYYAMPKPSYYMFKRCAKPVIASLEQEGTELRVYVCNDSLEPVSGTGKVYLYDFREDREVMATDFEYRVDANTSSRVLTVNYAAMSAQMTNSTVILCDIPGDRAFLIPDRYQDLDLIYGEAKILEKTENSVTITADSFLPFAMVDVPAILDDNCMPLKKGEVKTLKMIG